MKQCSRCKKLKSKSEFGKKIRNPDGLQYSCKDCVRAYMRERYKKEGKGLKQYHRYEECHRVVNGVKQKLCRRCNSWKAESDFYKRRKHKDGLVVWCKKCSNTAIRNSQEVKKSRAYLPRLKFQQRFFLA